MSRLEKLRAYIDQTLLNMEDERERRCAYVHLYGVSQFCALLALKRGQNIELAAMAGMLHDIYTYKKMDSLNHAEKGAVLTRTILNELNITTMEETDLICSAIAHHSDKFGTHSPFEEVLKDADVLQHNLYNPAFPTEEKEKIRYVNLLKEFHLQQ